MQFLEALYQLWLLGWAFDMDHWWVTVWTLALTALPIMVATVQYWEWRDMRRYRKY